MEETIDLKYLIRLLIGKIWLIILITVIGGAAAFGISKTLMPLEYSSHITMYVQSYYGVSDGINNQNNISNSKQLVNTYMEVLKDDAVMNAVGDLLITQYDSYTIEQNFNLSNGRITPGSLRSCISISSVTDTSAVNVVATAKNAEIAAAICNNLTSVAPEFVEDAVGVGSINTIDKAKVYNNPIAPNIPKNTILGMAMGFILIVMLLIAIDFFDNTVKDPDALGNKYNKAIIGEIQQFAAEKKNKKNKKKKNIDSTDYLKLTDKNVPFSVVESYKSIRTNITFSLSTTDKKIFAVSSANPGEGKSTTSANIAIAFAQSGKNVLLIDADMRKSMQHKIFNLKNKKGLSSAISKMNKVEECIQSCAVKHLDIMTAGPIPPNPSELLASKNMDTMLENLSEKYDIIIIDTSPINVVTDAMELAKNISGIITVLRYGKTTNDDIDAAIKKIEFAQMNMLGFILNGIKIKNRGKYYSKDRYYYKKGYGYYSVKSEPDEEENQTNEK
ncbi:MAG: polysaccharide biosynthesis tyrosine autokinase [Ruminococcus sp.]|nr:polysaccharide biosynthesis tyrosine autokinase [Ruminococcus sp.]